MKKKIQLFLLILFISHITITILINFSSFSFLKEKSKVKINQFGRYYINNIGEYTYFPAVKIYANYTGISHGYSYYCPNLPDVKIDYNLYNESKPLKNIVMMSESKLKFHTLMDNVMIYYNKANIKNNIMQSVYKNSLKRNGNLDELQIDVVMRKITPLDKYNMGSKRDSLFQVKGFNIKSL